MARRDRTEMMAHALEMDAALLPHASELLADLDELGADGRLIVDVLAELGLGASSFVVDLGCGKGAVAVRIAQRLGCRVLGIDLHTGLLADARAAADRAGVSDRCEFVSGDVSELAGTLEPADAVVYAALGDVLGRWDETMAIIRSFVRPGGFVLVNDSYLTDVGASTVPGFENNTSLEETRRLLCAHGDRLVDEKLETDDSAADAEPDRSEADLIAARAHALAARCPALTEVLDRFVREQRAEYAFLDEATGGAVWALQRRP